MLGRDVLDRMWANASLTDDESMRLALEAQQSFSPS
jgi:hypothetical protein